MLAMKAFCDVCQRMRGDANHWILGAVVYDQDTNQPVGYMLREWSDKAAAAPGMEHLCGDACAHRRQSENIRRGVQVGPEGPDFRIVDSEALALEPSADCLVIGCGGF
jgi:hypothetical protein